MIYQYLQMSLSVFKTLWSDKYFTFQLQQDLKPQLEVWSVYYYISSLIASRGGGEGEKASGTHCLHMHLIATEFGGDHVRTCTYVYC